MTPGIRKSPNPKDISLVEYRRRIFPQTYVCLSA